MSERIYFAPYRGRLPNPRVELSQESAALEVSLVAHGRSRSIGAVRQSDPFLGRGNSPFVASGQLL